MATTGPALIISFTVGTGQIVGQGDYSIPRCYLSTDPVSASVPTWTDVTSLMREYDTEHGRGTELDQFDAGTATITFDNRTRTFDPTANALIRPLNRIWLFEEFSGEVHTLHIGYAESWQQSYDKAGVDATATVRTADEMKILTLMGLPTTDPPRGSYEECVAFDKPMGFWRLDDDVTATQQVEPSAVDENVEPPTTEEDAPSPNPANPKGKRKAIPTTRLARRFPKK